MSPEGFSVVIPLQPCRGPQWTSVCLQPHRTDLKLGKTTPLPSALSGVMSCHWFDNISLRISFWSDRTSKLRRYPWPRSRDGSESSVAAFWRTVPVAGSFAAFRSSWGEQCAHRFQQTAQIWSRVYAHSLFRDFVPTRSMCARGRSRFVSRPSTTTRILSSVTWQSVLHNSVNVNSFLLDFHKKRSSDV